VDHRAFAGKLVAVVDDDCATVDAMRTLFQTWGAMVVGGATPGALLAGMGDLERYPDLIVADLRLANNQSGIDAVRQLRDEMGFAIPAIVVSGDTGTRADREARKAGLTLLPKPVVGTTLCAAALTALQRTGRSLETSRLVS
jgi:FixJ family two-component response regulator